MRLQRPTAGLWIAIALGCGGDPEESMIASAEGSSSGATTGSSTTMAVTTTATSLDTTLGTGESGSQSTTVAPDTSGGTEVDGSSSSADASVGESSSEGSSSGESGGDACTQTDDAPGGMCPEQCTMCAGNVCRIECTEADTCDSMPIVCPTDFECEIDCTGNNACHATNITCPKSWACTIACDGSNACHATEIGGAEGPVHVECSGPDDSVCHDLLLHCGSADSTIHCDELQTMPPPDPPKEPSDCQCAEMGC